MLNIKATSSSPDSDEIISVQSIEPVTTCWVGTQAEPFPGPTQRHFGANGHNFRRNIPITPCCLSSKICHNQGNTENLIPAKVKQVPQNNSQHSEFWGISHFFWCNFHVSDMLLLILQASQWAVSTPVPSARGFACLNLPGYMCPSCSEGCSVGFWLPLVFFSLADPIWE